MDHPAILPLHVLLGMLEVSNSRAYRILRDLSLQYRDVLPMVQELSPTMVHAAQRVVELSPETRRVIEYAIDEARRSGSEQIGSDHLLLALMKKPDYAIVNVLQRVSLDPDSIRRAARRTMLETQETGAIDAVSRALLTEQTPTNGNGHGNGNGAHVDPRLKIIQMVEDGKISAAEAGDLLRAMQFASMPAVAFTNRPANEVDQVRGRLIRFTLTDKTTKQPKANFLVSAERLQAEIFVLIQLLYNGHTGKVGEWDTANDHVQLSIE